VIPQIIAHRGNRSVTPENTLPAFAAAIASGAKSIEIDIVRSREGTPVVIHDATLDGTTSGVGQVADHTVTEIQTLDAGSWFSPAFAGAQVPTFAQFAAFMSHHPQVEILLEFKGDWDIVQTGQVVDIIDAHDIREQTILQSFNQLTIEAHEQVAPDMRRGVLVISREALERLAPAQDHSSAQSLVGVDELIEQCTARDIYTLNPFVEDVFELPGVVDRAHDAGLKVQTWTANSPDQWARLVELGVDGIITDRPDALNGWYAGRGLL
jgi:glycerophosphoryl diester phosphodiesterase